MLVSLTVKQAGGFPNIKLVNYDWLITSITNKLKSDESNFQFATKAAETNSKGKKRARSETPVKVNPIAHESPDGPPAKKQKDGNKAKSSSLRIPLDETCNAPGKCLQAPLCTMKTPSNSGDRLPSVHWR